jgi:hypothetical protein
MGRWYNKYRAQTPAFWSTRKDGGNDFISNTQHRIYGSVWDTATCCSASKKEIIQP